MQACPVSRPKLENNYMAKFSKANGLLWKTEDLAEDAVELAKTYSELPWFKKLFVPRWVRRVVARVIETIDEMTE